MNGLTTDLLSRACRIFLERAYPGGGASVPANRRRFWDLPAGQPLEPLLAAPGVCEKLLTLEGQVRGYALRLGSARFPHVKLQVFAQDGGNGPLFAVDTHDTLRCAVSPAEAQEWVKLQVENRRLKESIEQEWERQGLLTFNALLRQALNRK